MNLPTIKRVYLFFSSVFIFVLHVPFVFGKSKPGVSTVSNFPGTPPASLLRGSLTRPNSFVKTSVYDSLRLGTLGLGRQVFDYAIKGFSYMQEMGTFNNDEIISIVDFSKPSSQKRLFVVDLKKCKLLFHTYVAHGMQSGKEFARQFSNVPESNKSSLGFYETMGTYMGGNGYSLKLQGLERGINDNASKRAIVMHGAPYVNEQMIRSLGYIGRSFGCPAVPQRLHRPIIDKIKNGSCLFIYSPDTRYLAHSAILNQRISPSLAFHH